LERDALYFGKQALNMRTQYSKHSTLKMEATRASKTLVALYETTGRHIAEGKIQVKIYFIFLTSRTPTNIYNRNIGIMLHVGLHIIINILIFIGRTSSYIFWKPLLCLWVCGLSLKHHTASGPTWPGVVSMEICCQ
jgi:hypothetical protein